MEIEIDKPIAIAVILFIILVLSFYLVLPKYKTFQDLLIKVGEKEAEFQGKNAYFIEVTDTYKELMTYQDSLEKIDIALPNKLSLAQIFNLLYQKSVESGIVIKSINAVKSSPVGAEASIQETGFNIALSGSYASLKNFLSSLEKSARLVEVEGFSFSVTPPSGKNAVIQEIFSVNLSIKVYSY
jgi:Tfp pilus assembly protein PilO